MSQYSNYNLFELQKNIINEEKILITGGAGFVGTNLYYGQKKIQCHFN